MRRLAALLRTGVFSVLASAERHRARKRALRHWQSIEHSERQPSRPAQQRRVAAKRGEQAVRKRDPCSAVAATTTRVGGELGARADFAARRCKQLLRQLVCVAHSQIETLPGNRMQRLRRVAKQHDAFPDDALRVIEVQRKYAPVGDTSERFQLSATCTATGTKPAL